MEIVVNRDLCMGNGRCEATHAAVFEVADDGIVVAHNDRIREEDRERIERAVASCPTGALSIAEGE